MRVIIDRFEGKFAVCEKEDCEIINILRDMIPINAKESDVLYIDGDIIHIDIVETETRKKRIEKMTISKQKN